jgi:hypothetical protein
MDWLVLFGMQQLAGFTFGSVPENLGKLLRDGTKEVSQDIVKYFSAI